MVIKRYRPAKWIILFSLIFFALMIVISLVANASTISTIMNFDDVRFLPINFVYKNLNTDNLDNFTYFVMNDAAEISVNGNNDALSDIHVVINADNVTISSISDGSNQAKELLEPFFTKTECEAILWLVATKIVLKDCMNDNFNVQRKIGAFDINIKYHAFLENKVYISIYSNP